MPMPVPSLLWKILLYLKNAVLPTLITEIPLDSKVSPNIILANEGLIIFYASPSTNINFFAKNKFDFVTSKNLDKNL